MEPSYTDTAYPQDAKAQAEADVLSKGSLRLIGANARHCRSQACNGRPVHLHCSTGHRPEGVDYFHIFWVRPVELPRCSDA